MRLRRAAHASQQVHHAQGLLLCRVCCHDACKLWERGAGAVRAVPASAQCMTGQESQPSGQAHVAHAQSKCKRRVVCSLRCCRLSHAAASTDRTAPPTPPTCKFGQADGWEVQVPPQAHRARAPHKHRGALPQQHAPHRAGIAGVREVELQNRGPCGGAD